MVFSSLDLPGPQLVKLTRIEKRKRIENSKRFNDRFFKSFWVFEFNLTNKYKRGKV